MRSYFAVVIMFSCALLGACGGGSGSSQPATPPPVVQPPPPVATKSGGFWSGELFIESASVTEECAALLTEDGQFRFVCVFTDLQLAGMAALDGTALSGTGMAFSTLGFLDGSFATDLTLQATLVKETSLVGTWSTAAGDSGTFNMVYDADGEYDRASSLTLLEGVWQSTDEFDNPDASFTIDNLGSFTAQNTNSCTSSGMILILDGRYNLYQVTSTITGCAIAGDYDGLALLGDGFGINDVMLILLSNDQRALLVLLEKMP